MTQQNQNPPIPMPPAVPSVPQQYPSVAQPAVPPVPQQAPSVPPVPQQYPSQVPPVAQPAVPPVPPAPPAATPPAAAPPVPSGTPVADFISEVADLALNEIQEQVVPLDGTQAVVEIGSFKLKVSEKENIYISVMLNIVGMDSPPIFIGPFMLPKKSATVQEQNRDKRRIATFADRFKIDRALIQGYIERTLPQLAVDRDKVESFKDIHGFQARAVLGIESDGEGGYRNNIKTWL